MCLLKYKYNCTTLHSAAIQCKTMYCLATQNKLSQFVVIEFKIPFKTFLFHLVYWKKRSKNKHTGWTILFTFYLWLFYFIYISINSPKTLCRRGFRQSYALIIFYRRTSLGMRKTSWRNGQSSVTDKCFISICERINLSYLFKDNKIVRIWLYCNAFTVQTLNFSYFVFWNKNWKGFFWIQIKLSKIWMDFN